MSYSRSFSNTVFLQENNQKYYFAPIDNKVSTNDLLRKANIDPVLLLIFLSFLLKQSSVISLQNLIVREKAGQSSKGIFLISTNKNKEEMYELCFSTIKGRQIFF